MKTRSPARADAILATPVVAASFPIRRAPVCAAISLSLSGIGSVLYVRCRKEKRALYNAAVERKIFWGSFILLGLLADFLLPIWGALAATIPIAFVSWWIAYRSDWF